jgi:S-DNA-T family DNA segregation ATPase FtsK/SpoIIIE
MRIELTVNTGKQHHDLAVVAPRRTPFAQLAVELARSIEFDPGARLWLGERALAADASIADAGLRTGAVLSAGRPGSRTLSPGVLSLHIVAGPNAGTIIPLARGQLIIGRDDTCDIVLADADVSRRHAVIDVSSDGIAVRDIGSTNGTRVDGIHVPSEGSSVRPGCLIGIGDSLLAVSGPDQTPATLQPANDGTVLVLRPPRAQPTTAGREITLPTRSVSSRPMRLQWAAAILPAMAGAVLAWTSHSPQFLLFALLSPAMMISTTLGDRVHWRRSRRRDAVAFGRKCAEADLRVREAIAAETKARRSAAPDPAVVMRISTLPGSRLWERQRGDPDLLTLRLGVAQLPSATQARRGAALTPAGTLSSVPLCVDLRAGPMGVAGPYVVTSALCRWLVGQLAALHSPVDVEIGFLLSADIAVQWTWARWLPHVRGRVATSEEECARLVAELTSAADRRGAALGRDAQDWRGPWLVLVVDRASRLAEVPGLSELLARGASGGVSSICIDSDVAALPGACTAVARVDGATGTRLVLSAHADRGETTAVIDQVSSEWAEVLARNLAPFVDASMPGSSALPDECRLMELLDAGGLDRSRLDRRWAASAGGARTQLGISADGPLIVDLVTDGPHVLVAGTTGAGKSDLLQTLVAGLATNHPPDEINFLLIDYKGGAAFAECVRLPHTAGLVTDLDPYLTERALRSLHSELHRRERLFAEAGATDLDGYAAAGAVEQIPRLIIVVDEFAALAEELPEFVRGLVGVAQRGRSLGVHLVLATQRPGSAVSADIRANTSLRIALRVTDPSESLDVIDSPAAAAIERRHPGRAYLRTGSTLICFQTAYAGGTSPADATAVVVERLGAWRRRPMPPAGAGASTDIAQLIVALREAARRTGRSIARSPWLAMLPDAVSYSSLEPSPVATAIAFAEVDLPDEQRRATLSLDLGAGSSLLASGAARSGRTGLLTSLAVGAATQLAPDDLHLHVIDATGELSAILTPLPHCATVLGPDNLDLVPRLLHRLERECANVLAADGYSIASSGQRRRTLLLVDGWESALSALPDLDATACSEAIANLLRIGPPAGLSITVAGDRSTLVPRFANGFTARIVMRLADRTDYALAGIGARSIPASMPPGRGLRASDGAVLQVAHAGNTPAADDVRRAVVAIAAGWAQRPVRAHARQAIKIRPLPTRIKLDELPQVAGRLSIGLAGDQLTTVSLDPFAGGGRLLIAGPPRSGRTTVLCVLARQAAAARIATVVAAPKRSPLAGTAQDLAMRIVTPSDADIGDVPASPTLLLVDDSEAFLDSSAGERLMSWMRATDAPLAAAIAGRSDDLATTFRGVAAEARRSHCGILLRPGPVDGELLGIRLPRRPSAGPPGRGIAVGEPSWGAPFDDGEAVPIQMAMP